MTTKLSRPNPGDTTVRELVVRLCGECGCAIDTGYLCEYGCSFDGAINRPVTIYAHHRITEVFLRDEIRRNDTAQEEPNEPTGT